VKRSERWVAILLFGTAIFSAESAVRAASPANPACVRNGMVGLLRAPALAPWQKTASAKNQPGGEFQHQIAAAKMMAQAAYDQGLATHSAQLKDRKIQPSGFSIAVAVNGRVVWAQGYGFADLEQRVPVTPETKFRIGSVSKSLTAAAVARLVQEGKLDVDAPIQRYVPTFPDKGVVITTREVGGHLAGLRHYNDGEFETCAHYANVVDALAVFENDPLIAPPGTKFSYSSYGFNLISAVVRGAAGESFRTYMHDKVFTPLGMNNTVPDEEDTIVPNRARFYDYNKDGTYRNSPLTDNSYKWAGGGFLSTPADLVTFGSAMLQSDFLADASRKLLFTTQHTNDGKPTGYGFGWFIHEKPGEPRLFEHSGGATGGSAHLLVYPDQGVVMAWTMNTTRLNTAPLDDIAKVFVDAIQQRSSTKPPVTP
jgi:serine beta-lactamase-like protein LACTB, mitochondrial